MLDAFRSLSPVFQALVATTGTYLLTAIGRAFFWGQLSAVVEPVAGVGWRLARAGVRGVAAVRHGRGSRSHAVRHCGKLIPETVRSGTTDVATLGFIVGFTVMMTLDNALG